MSRLPAKLHRLVEAMSVVGCGADFESRRNLLSCYANLQATVTDDSEMEVRLRSGQIVVPCRMRRSDIFTLAEIFHEKQYELSAPLSARPIILDVGANIGVASLWLLGRYPDATVHAFEPEPENFRFLSKNLEPFSRVHVSRVAVGRRAGRVELGLAEHGAMHSTVDVSGEANSISVECIRLDSYLESHRIETVELLKLDVEGAELDVLNGLGLAARRIRRIVGEVHERHVSPTEFYHLLSDLGFRLVRKIRFRDGDVEEVHGFEAVATR